MDPVQKRWMAENWVADQKDKFDLAKNHAYLLASFDHPEQVQKLMGRGNVHTSTDEEFEESTRMVRELNLKSLSKPVKKRKRKKLKDNNG